MKILCLTTRLDRPSTKYRLLQYLPYINKSGIETQVMVISNEIKRWRILKEACKYDGVFIQKKLLSKVEQWYLSKEAKKIIYDFDDAIMYTKAKYSQSSRRYKRFEFMMDTADLVIAGNKYLAEIKYTGKTVVIPTVIDVNKYPVHERNNSSVTLGWIGTKSTQDYLNTLAPVLLKLTEKYPHLKVKIVSDVIPCFCENNIVWEKWNEKKEIDQLLSFDIGIMPLLDDPWTRGKCGFKIIQYMAIGIPVICSAIGVNTEIVKDGICGFFASSSNEWETAVSKLIDDIDLYRKTQTACRETVEKNYNLSYWGPFLAELLEEKLC